MTFRGFGGMRRPRVVGATASIGLLLAMLCGGDVAKAEGPGRRLEHPRASEARVQQHSGRRKSKARATSGAATTVEAGVKTRGKAARRPHGSRHACVDSYKLAVERVEQARPREAKDLFQRCASATCGRLLRKECTVQYSRLESDASSSVPVVTNASARNDLETDTKVAGEGAPITKAVAEKNAGSDLTSRPAADAEAPGGRTRQVREREEDDVEPPNSKGVAHARIAGKTGAPHAGSDAGSESTSSWPIYAWGGVGLLGVGGYAALTWKGRQDNNTLVQSCKPDCNPASVHHIRMVYLAADASLGVGVASLLVSTWLYLRSNGAEEKAAPPGARISVIDVQPTSSGAFATVGGKF